MDGVPPRLAVCLVVKNEEAFIGGCLESVKELGDAMFVFDTGSHDQTPAIASRYGAQLKHLKFGGDFSAVRNSALDHIQAEWILVLDADERIEADDARALLDTLASVPESVAGFEVLRYNFFPQGGWYSGRRIQLFRGDRSFRYTGRIHESIRDSILASGNTIARAPVIINHYGYWRPWGQRNAKWLQYLTILEKAIAETPYDAMLHGYSALIMRALGDIRLAEERSKLAVGLAHDNATVRGFRGHVLRASRDLHGARSAYVEASEMDASGGSWTILAGVMSLMLGEWDRAESELYKGWRSDPLLFHAGVNLALVAEAKGSYSDAVELYERVLARNAGFGKIHPRRALEDDTFGRLLFETPSAFAGVPFHLAYSKVQRDATSLEG